MSRSLPLGDEAYDPAAERTCTSDGRYHEEVRRIRCRTFLMPHVASLQVAKVGLEERP
jgi:hypothetical protein